MSKTKTVVENIEIDVVLSPGLNVVIGDSSSGKTLFVDTIICKTKGDFSKSNYRSYGVESVNIDNPSGSIPHYINQNYIMGLIANNKNEIEKAIVLRDGKPAVILLDFAYYEEIMKDYLLLKEQKDKPREYIKKEISQKEIRENIKEEYVEKSFPQEKNNEFSFDSDLSTEKPEPLKEFWD